MPNTKEEKGIQSSFRMSSKSSTPSRGSTESSSSKSFLGHSSPSPVPRYKVKLPSTTTKGVPSFNTSKNSEHAQSVQESPLDIPHPAAQQPPSVALLQDDDLRPGYTRRLIPMIGIPAEEIDENFDEAAWFKKVYGPDVTVVQTVGVPDGWILVDRIDTLFLSY